MIKSKFQKLLFIGFLVFLFSVPILTQAAGGLVPCGGQGQPACQFCHIFILLINIIELVLKILTPIVAVLMFVTGGLYLLTAGGNPQSFEKAKSVLTAAVIGLVIIFVAWVFLSTFLDFIGVFQWTGLKNWWNLTGKCPI